MSCPGLDSDLLGDLATGAHLGVLGAVELASRDLEKPTIGGISVLADEQGVVDAVLIGLEGKDHGRPRVADHLEIRLVAVGKEHPIEGEVDYPALVDGLSGDQPGLRGVRGWSHHVIVRPRFPACRHPAGVRSCGGH